MLVIGNMIAATSGKPVANGERHLLDSIPTGSAQQVAMLVYPDLIPLDLFGLHTVFSTLNNVQVHFVWKTRDTVMNHNGIPIQGIGIIKGHFAWTGKYQRTWGRITFQTSAPQSGSLPCEEVLRGPLARDGASYGALEWRGGGGKGTRVGSGTEPEFGRACRGRLGCLEPSVETGRGPWWGVAGQGQLGENHDDHGGSTSESHSFPLIPCRNRLGFQWVRPPGLLRLVFTTYYAVC